MKTALRSQIRSLAVAVILATGLLPAAVGAVLAQPGTSLGVVALPGNGACSVAGSFDGTYYITVNTTGGSCSGSTIGIYQPPAGGAGAATLISTKAVVDASNNPVTISAVDWDSSRDMLWAVFGSTNGSAYLIDLGDKTVSGPVVAVLQFNYNIPGIPLIDGLAWDFFTDTIWISADVSCCVFEFSPAGTPLGSITVKNADGDSDGLVSGVAIGANNTLYVGRNGTGEIRRVNKSNGDFVSAFVTTNFRVEDLTCDASTYAPKEAILAKDARGESYEAFEVEPGTCPQVPGTPFALDLQPEADTNQVGTQHCVTATVTDEDGEPVPDTTVVFDVEGASEADQVPPDEDGTATTNDEGVATFCYTGPEATGEDAIHAFADTDEDATQDIDEPFDDATKAWVAGAPASLVLVPGTDTNTVDDQHCVLATVRDAFSNPTPNVTVRFSVTGSVNTSGSAVTDVNGQATFCYIGPALPGADVITAYADTNNDNVNAPPPAEPEDTADKTWVLPASTPGCKVTDGGRITAANGDKATFGGVAMGAGPSGEAEYQDLGPATPINVHSIEILSVTCTDTTATIFGTATIDGEGTFDFRIDLTDTGEPGTADTYRIRLSSGYDSGVQVLDRGNVQIH